MSGKATPRLVGREVDLEAETITDSRGRRVDAEYVEAAVTEVHDVLAKRAGRPSLTGRRAAAPQVTFRLTPEMKSLAEQAALERGMTVSKLAREAFERFLA